MLAITKASLLFEGNISAATISFDNGKITAKGRSYYNKELAAVYKKYSMKNIDEDMLKSIPAGDVAAVSERIYIPAGRGWSCKYVPGRSRFQRGGFRKS